MGPQEVPAERLRSRGLRIPGEEGGHRMRLAEVDHMVREEDSHNLVVVEDIHSPVVDSLEVGLAEGHRTHLAEDHQEDQEDLGVGSRLVEEDSILREVEEGHLEEGRTADVGDKASVLAEDIL